MNQYDYVMATFQPQRTDNLKAGLAGWIGRRLEWQAGWKIEHGAYAGQWAMIAWTNEFPCTWVPQCDLVDLEWINGVVRSGG